MLASFFIYIWSYVVKRLQTVDSSTLLSPHTVHKHVVVANYREM